jgi:dTDP-4-amino-4,6-dideoxygalactose transaminase
MTYKIPLFDLNFDQREEDAIIETLRSKWISTGPKCAEFEEKFAHALNSNHAVSIANCTMGLHLALKALGIGEGDEIIVPSLTFVATVNAVKYVGATPVFADIVSNEDLTIDPDDIDAKITNKTKAIIPMHFGGFPCNMNRIMASASKNNLYVVEDACHGPLSEYQGKKLGTIGDFGCFSFFSNKNMSTGEGGMIICNNEALYKQVKLLRSHGMTTMSYQRASGHATKYDVVEFGYNYRMDDLRASIGIVQLQKLKDDLEKRAEIRKSYIKMLSNCNDVVIPFKEHTEFVSNYIFPIVLKNSTEEKREMVREYLHNHGIQTSVHYPAVHRFSIYKSLAGNLPKTEYVTDNEITLPMYSSLKEADIELIVQTLKNALC